MDCIRITVVFKTCVGSGSKLYSNYKDILSNLIPRYVYANRLGVGIEICHQPKVEENGIKCILLKESIKYI